MTPELLEAITVGICASLPVSLVGAPGVGRTSSVEAIGAHAEILILAQMEPTDLTGLPFVTRGERTIWAEPDWLARVNEADRAMFLPGLSRNYRRREPARLGRSFWSTNQPKCRT